MLKPTFVTTANSEPPTANRGLKFAVDCENAKLNVPNGKALDWLVSYLADCLQRVAVNGGVSSSTFPLKQGIPQGSYLVPMLFTVYTSTLFAIVEKQLPRVHCYAHDSQLYLSFSPSVPVDDEIALTLCMTALKI